MTRQVLLGSAFAAAMAVGLGAQGTGTAGQTGQTPPQQPRAQEQQSLTVTGCLMKADELGRSGRTGAATPAQTGTATGTATGAQTGAQAPRAAAGGDQFVLLRPAGMTAFNVRPGAAAGQTAQTGQTGQTAGTTGTASGAAALGYKLEGSEQHNLDKHVNNQIEVRGTLEPSSARSGQTGYGGGQTAQTGQTGQASKSQTGQANVENLPTLRVTSVRHVADTCSADNR